MPTGLINIVCDECYGGRIVYLPTGEIQLEHQPNCMYKYREDTFLINLAQSLKDKGTDIGISRYPKDAKLNPLIYDMLCAGKFTEPGNITFSKNPKIQTKAQNKAKRLNDHFQMVKEALKQDGRWP